MKITKNLKAVIGIFQFPALVICLLAAVPATAQTVIPVASFRAVEVREGAHVVLRRGEKQTVTLLRGSADCTRFTITDGDRLVIAKQKGRCSGKDEPEIEIIVPEIAEIRVENGGTIESRDSFPRQARIKAVVSNGGTVDIRTIASASVIAFIEEGGAIFVTSQSSLMASIVNGGQITYQGSPSVESSIRGGGAVTKENK